MSDFEDRLASALRSAGDDAPDAAGLAPAVHRRAGVRRRRTVLTSVAAVVAVVGGVGGVALLGNGSDRSPQVTDSPTPSSTAAPTPVRTERTESWRDLQVTVPVSWGHGNLAEWCTNGTSEPGDPVVERPGGMRDMILCTEPANGYGVMFQDGAALDFVYQPGEVWQYEAGDYAVYPVGAWLGYQRAGNDVVLVVTPDRATTERILGTVERDRGRDVNGCTAQQTSPTAEVAVGALRLCRYGVDDWLEQSELLIGQDAVDALAALVAAPAKGDRMCTTALTGSRVEVTSSEAHGQVNLNACQGFSWAGEEHDLTADVLYWTLSPGWSGGVEGDVPMPAQLRK